MNASAPSRWHSFYLFYGRPDHAENLTLFAKNVIERLGLDLSNCFFIRYPVGGPHVRLRVKSAASTDVSLLRQALADRCLDLATQEPAWPWAQTVALPDLAGRVFAAGHVMDVAYEPETVRYGGPETLVENEHLFTISSDLALQIFAGLSTRDPRRSAIASDLMLAAAAATDMDDVCAHQFFREYALGWRALWKNTDTRKKTDRSANLNARLETLRNFCRSDCEPRSLTCHWARSLQTACKTIEGIAARKALVVPQTGEIATDRADVDKALRSIIASQIHMLNNRLGVWPPAEIVLSEDIATRLRTDRLDN